ncbi:AgrD family cyclic lactone autoinducer peptide [Mediterraneibacter agrestimuris]|uniref:AgrD family cyclic lactone autoinducer peptide n=1 Tax=Mediterraneibacter agrestimuris TaxID=2941333 RepID=UPI00203C8684|nr:cyclic lactone autoinducer peptide [Mediterraneibacter agrestimuris]
MMKSKKVKDSVARTVLEKVAFKCSEVSANTKCMCIYHQLEKPAGIKKLRKF